MSSSRDLRDLPLEEIEPNLSQPRRYFDEATLQELAGSLSERGVLQPVLVRPSANGSYQLVVGERRWRAAKLAGLETIPALVSPCDDPAALETALIENVAREDLNPVEEARACATLVQDLGLSYREIGARLGCHKSVVSNLMRLLKLPEEILELLERGELSEAHGRALLMIKDPQARQQLARAAIEQGWSTRTLESRARESDTLESAPNGAVPASHGAVSTPDGAVPAPNYFEQDMTAMNIARVWGDAVCAEVFVRPLHGRKVRLEFVFDSPAGALAVGGQLSEAVARGTKRR